MSEAEEHARRQLEILKRSNTKQRDDARRERNHRRIEEREQRPFTQEELWDMGEDVPCPPSRMRPSAPST